MRLKSVMSIAFNRCARGVLTTLALFGLVTASGAGVVADQVTAKSTVRVCIWPAYYGVSFRNPNTQQLEGIDIDLSAELARDLKVKLQYVDSSFATL